MKNLYICILLVVSSLIINSCDQDVAAVTSKESSLAFTSQSAEVKEGDYLVYDIVLSEALSSDLILEGSFDATKQVSYTNPEDYVAAFEYSRDNGKTWQSEENGKLIKLSSPQRAFKIRVSTTDDTQPEFYREKMNIQLTKKEGDVTITNDISELSATILDNDVEGLTDEFIQRQEAQRISFTMLLGRGENDDFEIRQINLEATDKQEKQFVDEDYPKFLKMVKDLYATDILASLVGITVIYDNSSGFAAAVAPRNTGSNPLEPDGFDLTQWDLTINVGFGYVTFNNTPQASFDADGSLVTTLVHEIGHILTLGNSQRTAAFNTQTLTCNDGGVYIEEEFSPTYLEKSCFSKTSIARQFLNDFYTINSMSSAQPSQSEDLMAPQFVSAYSERNYSEDLAESFESFVGKKASLVASSPSNAAYLNKLALFSAHDSAVRLKAFMLASDQASQIGDVDENSNQAPAAFGARASMNPSQHNKCVLSPKEYRDLVGAYVYNLTR